MKKMLLFSFMVFFAIGHVTQAEAIYIDTLGPQVTDVTLDDTVTSVFNLSVLNKPVRSIFIHFQDRPARPAGVPDPLPPAFPDTPLASVRYKYNYELVNLFNQKVDIKEVIVWSDTPTGGAVATANVELVFRYPLPRGWYTLTVLDYLSDPAGNALDGETWGSYEQPQFPSGDHVPGRDFKCRFKIPRVRRFIK
jgi:hypothetical protein